MTPVRGVSAKVLLCLVVHYALGSGLFFCFGFSYGQILIEPAVGGLEIVGAGGKVVAFKVGLFTVHQVHVGHGIVIIGAQLDGFLQIVDAFLNGGHVLLFQV